MVRSRPIKLSTSLAIPYLIDAYQSRRQTKLSEYPATPTCHFTHPFIP